MVKLPRHFMIGKIAPNKIILMIGNHLLITVRACEYWVPTIVGSENKPAVELGNG